MKAQEGEDGDMSPASQASQEEEVEEPPLTGIWKWQPQATVLYGSVQVQVGVAVLIMANFMTNIVEKTIDPFGEKYVSTFEAFELFYNLCFTIELCVNMYSSWLCKFWKSSWNVFDFVVVSIGVATTLKIDLGPFTLLRMMRAFRVFRLFKRIESLRKIMASLARAVPGVINACLIQVIVMSIYAIIGVELFRTYGNHGKITTFKGEVNWKSPRQIDYGYEYFGNFPKAMYTMFQVLTGESWSEVVARTLIFSEDLGFGLGCALYFSSFTIINGIILINVVVAVLLEKMTSDEGSEEAEEEPWADGEEGEEMGHRPTLSGKARLQHSLQETQEELEEVRNLMAEVMDALGPARSKSGSLPRKGPPSAPMLQ